jgi:hypothetical protein
MECPDFGRERHELRRKVGTGQMKIAILLGDKDAISAIMEYVSTTGRLNKRTE